MLNKVCFFFNVLFKDGCFNGILNGIRGFVPQQLQTRGCSWRNDCHQFFPVMKNSSRISTFSILPHCSDKIKYVPLLLSLLLYPYSSMEKRLFKIWKHKLIPRRWGWGGQFGCSPPLSDGLSQNTYGIQPKWHQRDLRGHTQVCHPDSSHLQFKSPKEFVLCSHYKEQLWAYTIKFMIEELTDSRREIDPQKNGGGYSVKVKANGSISEPKYWSLSSGWGTCSFPPFIVPVSCLHPLKKATLKDSHFKWEWFCWHRVEQYSMAVKYNKGITVLFWFILMYKGRKRTNFKGFASGPDFRP